MYVTNRKHGAGQGIGAYASLDVESGAMTADPHQLIVMLFDGAEAHLRKARMYMQDGNVARKGEAISRVIDIVNQGLLAALDMEKGGQVAENLSSIYDYVTRLLLRANRDNDLEALREAEKLLADIGSAWRQIKPLAQQAG